MLVSRQTEYPMQGVRFLADITNPHAKLTHECFKTLDATESGLAAQEAKNRQAVFGPNRLPAAAQRSVFLRFLLHFNNVLMYVLIGAAAVTAALGHMIGTWVILAVVMANAIMGFIQEGRAENRASLCNYLTNCLGYERKTRR